MKLEELESIVDEEMEEQLTPSEIELAVKHKVRDSWLLELILYGLLARHFISEVGAELSKIQESMEQLVSGGFQSGAASLLRASVHSAVDRAATKFKPRYDTYLQKAALIGFDSKSRTPILDPKFMEAINKRFARDAVALFDKVDFERLVFSLRGLKGADFNKAFSNIIPELEKKTALRLRNLASFSVNISRIYGQVASFVNSGVQYYKWIALPGRCGACAEMEGTIFPVSDAVDKLRQIAKLQSVMWFSLFMPIVSSAEQARRLKGTILVLPPMHPNCRCFLLPA